MDESDEPHKCGFAMITGIRSMDDRKDDPAWTRQLACWNTAGTVVGAIVGIAAVAISVVALVIVLVQ